MLGLKIFVRVQTFRRRSFAQLLPPCLVVLLNPICRSDNFCIFLNVCLVCKKPFNCKRGKSSGADLPYPAKSRKGIRYAGWKRVNQVNYYDYDDNEDTDWWWFQKFNLWQGKHQSYVQPFSKTQTISSWNMKIKAPEKLQREGQQPRRACLCQRRWATGSANTKTNTNTNTNMKTNTKTKTTWAAGSARSSQTSPLWAGSTGRRVVRWGQEGDCC